jgi:hypothetical protein
MNQATLVWTGAVILYLIVIAIREFRLKHYLWAAIPVVLIAAAFFLPVETHSVTIDLPAKNS